MIRGTPQYMSPEQARGRRLDHRTDLYSLGVMLYECATGELPFQGPSMAMIGQHISTPPDPPRALNPELSPALEALILGLLAKEPDDRPASGQAVAGLLRDEIERTGSARAPRRPTGPAPGPSPTPAPPRSRTRLGSRSWSRRDRSRPVPAPKPMTPVPAVLPSTAAPRTTVPLVREMLEAILAEPIALSPDERYLCGHYLAYLLGGSRRRGLFLRRPLDPLNADRARLLLAMTWLTLDDAPPDAIDKAVELLETRPDVRPSLSPIVVAKYLAGPRDARQAQAVPQAPQAVAGGQRLRAGAHDRRQRGAQPRAHAADARRPPSRRPRPHRGRRPGRRPLEPDRRRLADRRRVPPVRAPVRDPSNAHRDPASAELWPEVVYPLIERARWHRRSRGGAEALWDNLCARLLHVPDAGVRLDRAIHAAVPAQVVEKLDLPPDAFEDDPQLGADPVDSRDPSADRFTVNPSTARCRLDDLAADAVPAEVGRGRAGGPRPDPLHPGRPPRALAGGARRAPEPRGRARAGHRSIPIGPYRLSVIPSIRGRSAGEVVIQGMPNKQIELMTPSLRGAGSASKPILAVWVYLDNSLVIAYVDFRGTDRYIFWHAPTAHQSNIADPAELDQALDRHGLEPIDGLDRALSKRFRPRNPA